MVHPQALLIPGRGSQGQTALIVSTSFEDGTLDPFSGTGVTIVNGGTEGTKCAEIAADAGFGTNLSIGVHPSQEGWRFVATAWVAVGTGSFFGQIKSYTEAFGTVNATEMLALGPTNGAFALYGATHIAEAGTGRTQLEMYSFHATDPIQVDQVQLTRTT